MVVQHNISAMTANRYYGINNKGLAGSLEKLASGYAINKAGDNAAGLAVSEKMRAQIGGLTQASKNAEDGISMVQTFEGALQETDSILQRMRTLAVQSANGSYQNEVDRDAIQLEFDQLNDELNQIADTDFNGVVMLNGGVMADGTVANDPSKVAERPEIEDIKATPDSAFTYKSVVNGTVDSSGNGSVSFNGVAIKVQNGWGKSALDVDSAGNGKTQYEIRESNPLEVLNGKVNGTIFAKETYAIDDETTNIEIHGNNYTLSNGQLRNEKGDVTSVIDGFTVKVNGTDSVELNGSYQIKDNVVKTGSTFDDTTRGVGGVTDSDGNGGIVFNNTAISLDGGAGEATDTNGITFTASNVKTGTNATTGNAEVTGQIVASGDDLTFNQTGADWVTTENITFTKADAPAGVNLTTDVYKARIGNQDVYTTDGTNFYSEMNASATGDTDILLPAKKIASITIDATGAQVVTNGTAAADNATFGSKSITFADFANDKSATVTTTTYGYKLGDTKYRTNKDQSKFMTPDTGVTDATLNKKAVGYNGVEISVKGKISGTTNISTSPDAQKVVGSFKVSNGVSTSDAYNHGNRNLTFADSMTLQVGARGKDAVKFNFDYTTNGIGTLKADMNASARGLGTDQLKLTSQEDANYAIDQIDNAINKTNMIRATFGAVQNRLEHKINNIDTNAENLTAAESRIRDTQMDKEMMKFTSSQILSQASQSMLAQANSLPQGVLQLLG